MEIVLILETETETQQHIFNSTDELELYLNTIDLSMYSRTNILFYIDGEMNYEIMKIYKQKYLNKKIELNI